MSCQRCDSARLLAAGAKCSDLFSGSVGRGADRNGYVPDDLGIGGGDYVELCLCLDCGQLQGDWPLPRTAWEREDGVGDDAVANDNADGGDEVT